MTTKRKISQQVLYRINGGMTNVNSAVKEPDVIEALGQIVNSLFKTQHFNVTLQLGDTVPDGAMIATYGPISVTSLNGHKSQCILPIMPISLPRGMGVSEVSPYEDFRTLYIPILPGQSELLNTQALISDLLGQVGFEVYKDKIITTKDITINNITSLYMRLVVMDISQYDYWDPLPIPSDLENDVVDELVKRFAPVQSGYKVSDIISPQNIAQK